MLWETTWCGWMTVHWQANLMAWLPSESDGSGMICNGMLFSRNVAPAMSGARMKDGKVTGFSSGSGLLSDTSFCVRSGRRYVPSVLAEVLADGLSSPALTPREQQVLEKIAEGRSNKQIAAELGLGTRTVKEHFTSIFRKLGVQDRTEALGVAIRRGLVRLS